MSVNRHQPHVMVLPEDDANRQLVKGFRHEDLDTRSIQVLEEVGGWTKVLDCFVSDHVADMDRFPSRFMVLLIDFDEKEDRLHYAKAKIPKRLTDRVFILGAWSEPEKLKPTLGSYEAIGLKLARDCREETNTTWGHDLLRHNAGELDRLRKQVLPLLF